MWNKTGLFFHFCLFFTNSEFSVKTCSSFDQVTSTTSLSFAETHFAVVFAVEILACIFWVCTNWEYYARTDTGRFLPVENDFLSRWRYTFFLFTVNNNSNDSWRPFVKRPQAGQWESPGDPIHIAPSILRAIIVTWRKWGRRRKYGKNAIKQQSWLNDFHSFAASG